MISFNIKKGGNLINHLETTINGFVVKARRWKRECEKIWREEFGKKRGDGEHVMRGSQVQRPRRTMRREGTGERAAMQE